jgi:hypothetical protein
MTSENYCINSEYVLANECPLLKKLKGISEGIFGIPYEDGVLN